MADSQKGKKSKHHYSVHVAAQGHSVYCTKGSRYLSILEVGALLKSDPKVVLKDQHGKSYKAYFKKRAAAELTRQLLAAESRQRKAKKIKKLQEQSGLYCDCLLSNKFKTVADWKASDSPIKPSDIGKPRPAQLSDKGLCAFCGYTPFYVNFAPGQGRPMRSSLKGVR